MFKFYKSFLWLLCLCSFYSLKAQYTEDFGGPGTATFPVGWNATSDWVIDPNDLNGGGIPECTVAGTSKNSALVGYDASGTVESVITSSFTTMGYSNLKVRWNGYRSSGGAPTVTLAWSTDGVNFTNVPFTDVVADDDWHALATPVTLPAAAEYQSTVYLRFSYTSTAFGLFMAFDDLTVTGSTAAIYYWNGSGVLTSTASWGTNANGSGTHPTSFTTGNCVYNMVNASTATLAGTWTFGGVGVKLNVGDGVTPINFTMPAGTVLSLSTATMEVTNTATLTLRTTSLPTATMVTLSTGSTVDYAQTTAGVSILLRNHHNLRITGGVDKVQPGNIMVAGVLDLASGSLMMSNNTIVTLTLNGTITGTGLLKTGNSRLTIGGSGPFGTLYFGTGSTASSINRLTIDRTPGSLITLGSGLTVVASAVFTNGDVALNSFTLTNQGIVVFPATASNGTFIGGGNSSLTFNGSGTITNNLLVAQTNTTTASIKNLLLSRASTSLTIGNMMNITGDLTATTGTVVAAGNVHLVSTSSIRGRIGVIGSAGDISGNVIADVFAKSGRTGWTTLGSPGLSGLTFTAYDDNISITCPSCPDGSTAGGAAFTSVNTYNEQQGSLPFGDYSRYHDITTINTAMTPGKGFWVYLGNGTVNTTDITLDAVGPVTKKTFATIPLTRTGVANADHGWNLIANPYPSPISLSAVRTGNTANIDNAVYVWNPDLNNGNGDFAVYSGGVSSPAVGSGGVNDNIPMGQGFYLHVINACTLTPTENWKSSSTNLLLKSTSTSTSTIHGDGVVFRLKLTGGGSYNYNTETVFHFNSNATTGYDTEYDALQMPPSDPSTAQIFSDDNGMDYRINAQPALDGSFTIPVKTLTGHSGTYSITPVDINQLPAGACVTLFDKFTNITHNLRNGVFSFTLSDTTTIARFVLTVSAAYDTLSSALQNPACTSTSDGKVIALGNTAGPWNYYWKDTSGVSLKTSLAKVTADTLTNVSVGAYMVEINTVGTCDNATGIFSLEAPGSTGSFIMDTDTAYTNLTAIVNFTNTSVNTDTYNWNFGDGATANTLDATHTYTLAGDYTVTLQSINSTCGDTVTTTAMVTVITQTVPVPTGIDALANAAVGAFVSNDNTGTYVRYNFEGSKSPTVIRVFNMLGQEAIQPIVMENQKDKVYLNIPNAKNQILLINVTNGDKRYTAKYFNN